MRPAHGVIVLARLDSARLPGKALADVGGRPVLSRLLERLRVGGDGLGPIVLATTHRSVDDPLAEWAAREGVRLVRHAGPVGDVARRFVDAARDAGLAWAARVNGDSPLVDATLLRRALGRALDPEHPPVDLVTNLRPRRHPYGMAVEWVRVRALSDLLPTFDEHEREHVTRGLYATLPSGRIAGLEGGDPAWADVRTVVDTAEDLDRLRRFVADHADSWPLTPARDVVAWSERARDGGAPGGRRSSPSRSSAGPAPAAAPVRATEPAAGAAGAARAAAAATGRTDATSRAARPAVPPTRNDA